MLFLYIAVIVSSTAFRNVRKQQSNKKPVELAWDTLLF